MASQRWQKRIMREWGKEQKESDPEREVMWRFYDPDDMSKILGLVIGAADSPYAGGFWLFDITIPLNYPMSPPKFSFLNASWHGQSVRIHPNFYYGGKCCLSIINQWGNNEWSPAMSISKVLFTIQAQMGDNPVSFEPAYSKKASRPYELAARFHTLDIGVRFTQKIIEEGRHKIPENIKDRIKAYLAGDKSKREYAKHAEFLSEDAGTRVSYLHGTVSLRENLIESFAAKEEEETETPKEPTRRKKRKRDASEVPDQGSSKKKPR